MTLGFLLEIRNWDLEIFNYTYGIIGLMFIEANKLINLPIAALDTQSKIGQIQEIIIDPENGHILGFLVKIEGILSKSKALSIVDIREWDKNGIVTDTLENLVDPAEIIRLKTLIDKKIILIGMKTETESGKNLGKVEDLLIDTDTQRVAKYYLKDLLGQTKILTSDKVIRIDKKIIFTDDVTEPTGGAVETQAV